MLDLIFSIAVLIMSVVIHEVSHGALANLLGDQTAKDAGRLTLNPLKHLDPFGSVLLPYNPYNLSNQRWGPALVGAAGPGSNILIALAFSLVVRSLDGALPASLAEILTTIILINILLAI